MKKMTMKTVIRVGVLLAACVMCSTSWARIEVLRTQNSFALAKKFAGLRAHQQYVEHKDSETKMVLYRFEQVRVTLPDADDIAEVCYCLGVKEGDRGVLWGDKKTGCLIELFVNGSDEGISHRGNGLGQFLFAHAIKRLKEWGARKAVWDVAPVAAYATEQEYRKALRALVSFYQKCGARVVGNANAETVTMEYVIR